MLLFPFIGRKAWIITDIHETMCTVPITIIPLEDSDLWELLAVASDERPKHAVRWQICDSKQGKPGYLIGGKYKYIVYHEDYYLNSRRGLYRSEARARAALRRMKEKADSKERRRRK